MRPDVAQVQARCVFRGSNASRAPEPIALTHTSGHPSARSILNRHARTGACAASLTRRDRQRTPNAGYTRTITPTLTLAMACRRSRAARYALLQYRVRTPPLADAACRTNAAEFSPPWAAAANVVARFGLAVVAFRPGATGRHARRSDAVARTRHYSEAEARLPRCVAENASPSWPERVLAGASGFAPTQEVVGPVQIRARSNE